MNHPDIKPSVLKGKELLKFIECLYDVLEVIQDAKNYAPLRERYYYTIFIKLLSVLDSLIFQVINLDGKPHYAVSVILCLRTCMLDVLAFTTLWMPMRTLTWETNV